MFCRTVRVAVFAVAAVVSSGAYAAPCKPSLHNLPQNLSARDEALLERVRCGRIGNVVVGEALERSFLDVGGNGINTWNLRQVNGITTVIFGGALSAEGVESVKAAIIEHTKGKPQGAPERLRDSLSLVKPKAVFLLGLVEKNGLVQPTRLVVANKPLAAIGWPDEVYLRAFFR